MYWHFSEYRGRRVLNVTGGDGKDGTRTRSTPKVKKTDQQDPKVKIEQQDGSSETEDAQGNASDTKKE